jgi:NDP-sugar pyrophosphorylase family protein
MKAMVLCAGYGTRLGDLTREVPKPMLRLGRRPMLEYILRHLKRHGFDQIGLNLHFMPEAIRGCFGDGSRLGLRIRYAYEPQLLGTAGGTKNMEAFLRRGEQAPFLVHYGDVVTNQNFTAMLDFHRKNRALATLLVHRRAMSNSVVYVDADGRIERFLERPSETRRENMAASWVFSGVAICEPQILDLVPAGQFRDFPRDIFMPLAGSQKFFAFPLAGKRCAVDSPQRLEEARRCAAEGDFSAGDVPGDDSEKLPLNLDAVTIGANYLSASEGSLL